jgi:Arc/MetJ-type ribon-helix-helix transcriptional regulator
MTQVAIQLPDELSQFVQKSVDSGAYQNADEFFVSVVATFKEQVESRLTA